ncbi:platelet glycoprotein 4 [Periophthalmus magnuspinnatus]|uniref:platelet glycoprotein 4 n=1 Tax=Periophthalmus magnuspinnatus TaxID=409849 RepID=UPI00145BBD57|nr:platelet glycoprotein 4 [Periophthalmus magnuspinnatus]
MGCCNARCWLITGAVFGVALAILGGVLIPVGNIVIEGTVNKEAVIEPGTTAYDNWVAAGATVYRQFWFFTVKNPTEVIENGATPVVMERGPYTYKTRFLPKDNITFNSNHTASFVLPTVAIFDPSMSAGTEDDEVVVLNLAVAGAYSLAPKPLHGVLERKMNLTNSSLFQTRSVKELLWGYTDPLIKNTVALFENGTYDGPYTVFTGKDDISKVSMIETYRGESKLKFWKDQYCDMINGTDASSFAPFVDKKKPLYFFSSDICRSVSASHMKTYSLKGIKVFRYSLLPSTLASPVDNPDNHCFCHNKEITKNCTIAGVLDISSCQNGKPIFISLPHFLLGSSILTESVQGLNPIPEHHETFLDVEPTTGFTLNFAKRIQVNMMYGPSKVITVLKKVKDYTIFPVVWLNETATLDDATADMIKGELVSRINLLSMVQKTLLGAGIAIAVLCFISYCFVKRNRNQGKLA